MRSAEGRDAGHQPRCVSSVLAAAPWRGEGWLQSLVSGLKVVLVGIQRLNALPLNAEDESCSCGKFKGISGDQNSAVPPESSPGAQRWASLVLSSKKGKLVSSSVLAIRKCLVPHYASLL